MADDFHHSRTVEADARREALERAGLALGKARGEMARTEADYRRAQAKAEDASNQFDLAEAAYHEAVGYRPAEKPPTEAAGKREEPEAIHPASPPNIAPAASAGPGNGISQSDPVSQPVKPPFVDDDLPF